MQNVIGQLKAYGVITGAVVISFVVGELLPTLPGVIAEAVGVSAGIWYACRYTLPSMLGVAAVVVLLTVVAPLVLVLTAHWVIGASALAGDPNAVSEWGPISVHWSIALPILAAIVTLWARLSLNITLERTR